MSAALAEARAAGLPAPVAARPERTLGEELIAALARQGRRVPIPVFLSSMVVAIMASRAHSALPATAWLAAVAAVLTVRWLLLGRLPTMHRLTVDERIKVAIALSALNGVVQAASTLFTPWLDVTGRAALTVLLLGLCAGSVATTAGYRPIFMAFMVPAVLSLSLAWAFGPVADDQRWIARSVAALILVFGAMLLALAADAYRLFSESFEIRRDQIELNRLLRSALGDAETANRAKTRFLASASHDLRQPLHTLSLFSAALMMRPLDASTRTLADQMGTALRALGTQLDALLDISKLDAGIVAVRPAVFSLAAFMRQRDAESRMLAEAKGLSLTFACPPDAFCEIDEALFARLVRNLIDNAIKYTDAGWVTVQVHVEGVDCVVRIRDSGRGIPASEHEHVFEEFYQLDNPERDRTRGLGLGLSIVRRLSSLLGVRVALDSAVGRGTEFCLTLPLAQREAPREVAGPPPPTALPLKLQVLVIDDEEAVRKGMEALLASHGCAVASASGIAAALASGQANPPDIVVADLRLRGGEDGIAAIRQLREAHPDLPALLVSGDTAPDRLQEAHAAGVRLLSKPVDPAELVDAIAREIQRGSHHADRGDDFRMP